jgi:hypothetical protein
MNNTEKFLTVACLPKQQGAIYPPRSCGKSTPISLKEWIHVPSGTIATLPPICYGLRGRNSNGNQEGASGKRRISNNLLTT